MKTLEFAGFREAIHSSQMIRLLQRMDDSEPRHTVAGKAARSSSAELRSLTLLADANESEHEALEDWARGLDWVLWLFSSVRQRMSHLHFHAEPTDSILKLRRAWEDFSQSSLMEILAPHLLSA